jgi:insertion element IS1 protein InsB
VPPRRALLLLAGARLASAGRDHLHPDEHCPGKRHTQQIERKPLTLRTRIKRLVRQTIFFSKTMQMHDIVIGLAVNRYAFGRMV